MTLSKFGPFATVFEKGELKVPGHLELLSLNGSGADIVIARVKAALSIGDPRPWIDALFDDPNWRPHLAGAIALLLDSTTRLDCGGLWRAIDAGSWVTPQLAVTAYLVDPSFPGEVIRRIELRGSVSPPEGLSPIERHSFTGPAGRTGRIAKQISSLIAVGRRVPELRSFLDEESRQPDIAEIISQDIDKSDRIADSWFEQAVRRFASRQLP